MRPRVTLVLCLALAVGTLGCGEQSTEPAASSVTFPAPRGGEPVNALTLEPGLVPLLHQGQVSDGYLADLMPPLIDPADYVCDPDSPLFDWLNAEVERAWLGDEPEMIRLLGEFLVSVVPLIEARFLLTDDTPQSFGYDGAFTNVLRRTERDAKLFWSIPSNDIQLLAMKGTMLLDEARVATVYQTFFRHDDGSAITAEQAAGIAATVRELLLQAETLNGGNHPLFSFNAFAATSSVRPERIIVGDGVLEGYRALGLGDVAPQAIYAHEFAHHIQFDYGYFQDPVPGATTQAERTRYTELMADAMAGYFLTHKRGAAMNRHRVAQFLAVFFQIGDCGFDFPGHHGTPNQRMQAAEFGFDVADQAQKNGHILTAQQFHELFVAEYPNLVAPDAT